MNIRVGWLAKQISFRQHIGNLKSFLQLKMLCLLDEGIILLNHSKVWRLLEGVSWKSKVCKNFSRNIWSKGPNAKREKLYSQVKLLVNKFA